MSSSQYITLDEFNSTDNPVPTILVPKSHAQRLVELCELSEQTPTKSFLDFIGMNDNGSAAADDKTNGSGDESTAKVLVTQMALLLYLGEYTNARHLWRRQRKEMSGASTTTNDDLDYTQLELLWNAAKYCYLWSTGGIHSLASNSAISSSSAVAAAAAESNGMMQVEQSSSDIDTSGDDATLPFSTLALRALETSASKKAAEDQLMEPLSTYSKELLGVFRSRVNKGLHESFDKLDQNEFLLRMNLTAQDEQTAESFGWKLDDGGYLVSNVDVVLDDVMVDEEYNVDGAKEGKDRIGKLTDIVMFLEGKMNA